MSHLSRAVRASMFAVLGVVAVAMAVACDGDNGTPTPVGGERVEVEAPVESIEILVLESFPVQYRAQIVSGLPNGCHLFERYEVEREDGATEIEITVWNTIPAGDDIACAEIYGTHEGSVDLGSDFESGVEYTVTAGEVTERFTAQ
jgi:hypothetical protein